MLVEGFVSNTLSHSYNKQLQVYCHISFPVFGIRKPAAGLIRLTERLPLSSDGAGFYPSPGPVPLQRYNLLMMGWTPALGGVLFLSQRQLLLKHGQRVRGFVWRMLNIHNSLCAVNSATDAE